MTEHASVPLRLCNPDHAGPPITLPASSADSTAELSPRSKHVAPSETTESATRLENGGSPYFSDHSDNVDPEGADATTPRTSFSSGSCTPPKQPFRRASGRRPLSVLSSSSINSDSSPLHLAAADSQGNHGLGVSYSGHPPSGRAIVQHTPDPYSPSKHRRHRSMISAPIDYRTHYTSPQFAQPLYVNYTPRAPQDPAASPSTSTSTHSHFAYYGHGYNGHGHHYGGAYGPHGQTYGGGAYPSPGPSPLFESPSAATTPLSVPPSPAQSHSDPIQDLFVAMAYKERQVLEARQNLEEATEVLNAFKRQLKAMITPSHQPIRLPCRPTIISRRHCPNVGIHALAYKPWRRCPYNASLRIVRWSVDNEVSPLLDDEMCDDEEADESAYASADGVALRIVKCLLGIVHCIIATLPVHQRDFAAQQPLLSTDLMRPQVPWAADYPLPMETLFGYLAYDV